MRISYTGLSSLMKCEYSYYLRYVKRVPTKESSASVFGTAIHKTIYTGYTNDLERDDWAKFFANEWISSTAGRDIIYYSANDYMRRLNKGKEMAVDYYDTFVKGRKKPIALEHFFGRDTVVSLGNHSFIGVIDQISAGNKVIDYKSGAKPTKNELEFDLQFTIYSYAYRQMFGKDETGLALRHLGTMKDMPTTRTESDFTMLSDEMDKIEKRLKGKTFIRNLGRDCSRCYFVEHCLGKTVDFSRW